MTSLCLAFGIVPLLSPQTRSVEIQFARPVSGQNVTVMIDGRQTRTTFAGKLGFRDQNRTWLSLCADVRSPIASGQFFTVRPRLTSQIGGRATLAGNIVAKYFRSAKTADQCAGLQLAVWEAMEDGGEHANFGAGRFRAKASMSALDYGQEFYEAIYEAREAAFLESQDGGGQDQISTT